MNVAIFLYIKPIPIIKNIVHETNVKLSNIDAFKTVNDESDQTYLEYLGFSDMNIKQSQVHHSVVVGSAVSYLNFNKAFEFLDYLQSSLSNIYESVILFDTGLRSSHINQLKKRCNKSIRCQIKNFEFEKFPVHISHLPMKSFKPLAIQMLMQHYEAVIWIDMSEPQFLPLRGCEKQWKDLLKNASLAGVKGWPIIWPTSSVTHPGMIRYFGYKPDQFYFHRMISTNFFVIFRSEFVKKKIMLPWIKCILSYNCIEPLGSKNSACNFNREPHFLFSGCHWYEMSAFNVVLGGAFNMDSSLYMVHNLRLFEIDADRNNSAKEQFYLTYAI